MKLELPLALVLIAAGCWLWSQHLGTEIPPPDSAADSVQTVSNAESGLVSSLDPRAGNQNATLSSADSVIHRDSTSPTSQRTRADSANAVRHTQYLQAVDTRDESGTDDLSADDLSARDESSGPTTAGQGSARQVPPLQASVSEIADKADPASRQLVVDAAKAMQDSIPLTCSVRVSARMFDNAFRATGQYVHKGQGSRKSKLEITHGSGDNALRLIQVCDGRLYYRLIESGETDPSQKSNETQLEFVDLDRLHMAANGSRLPASYSAGSPTGWMSTGGLASLLDHLSRSFTFAQVHESKLGDINTLVVRGVWDEATLRNSLSGQIDSAILAPEINWAALPEQIPHAVELTFGNDEFLPLFPYRIAFLRFRADADTDLPNASMVTVATLELFDVTKLETIDDSVFVVDPGNIQTVDMTDEYVAQMEQRHEIAAAANKESADSIRRTADAATSNTIPGTRDRSDNR